MISLTRNLANLIKWSLWISVVVLVVGLARPAGAVGLAPIDQAAHERALSGAAEHIKAKPMAHLHRRHAGYASHRHRHSLVRSLAAQHRRDHRLARAAASNRQALSVRADALAPPAPCGVSGAHECRSAGEAEASLVFANRRAIARGVPAPLLRVGLDNWLEQRATAASAQERLDAYEDRLAFVDETVATRSNWRAAYISRQDRVRLAMQAPPVNIAT